MIFQGIELAVVAAAMAELHWLLTVYLVLHYLEERQCLKFSHRRLIDNALFNGFMAVDGLDKLAGFYLQHTAVGSKFLVIYSIDFHGVLSYFLRDYPTGQGIAAPPLYHFANQQPISRSFLPDIRFCSIFSKVTFLVSGTKLIVNTMNKPFKAA